MSKNTRFVKLQQVVRCVYFTEMCHVRWADLLREQKLESLDITGIVNADDATLDFILSKLPNLSSLNLINTSTTILGVIKAVQHGVRDLAVGRILSDGVMKCPPYYNCMTSTLVKAFNDMPDLAAKMTGLRLCGTSSLCLLLPLPISHYDHI